MTFARMMKLTVKAPVMAVGCAILGILLAGLLLLASGLIHLVAGIDHGPASQLFVAVAKYLPLLFGVGGFLSATDSGLLIGRDPLTNKLLRYEGPAHLLTMAPTRTGKGVGTIIPNLLTAERSVICIDPKGENAKVTGRARAQFGPVHILDPFGVTGQRSAAFNPLDTLDPNGLDVAEDASTLADALVFDEPGMAGEAHWNEEAKALIAGLILAIAVGESPERRHLATLREYLTFPPERFATLLAVMQEMEEVNGLIARAANRHLGKSDREAAGVLSAAQRHTHFLDSPRMTAVLGRSDFRCADLKRNNATIFLVLPPDRISTYSRWLRLLITQSLTDMARDPASPTRLCSTCWTNLPLLAISLPLNAPWV
jgi:type IV secretion system protein VirD4